MDNYRKQLESEAMQFLFLADKNDSRLLVSRYKKKNMPEFVRLACLALTFGYKKLFVKICTTVQSDYKSFISGLDKVTYALYEGWVSGFISRISDGKVQALCRGHWEADKKQLDVNNFSVRQLL